MTGFKQRFKRLKSIKSIALCRCEVVGGRTLRRSLYSLAAWFSLNRSVRHMSDRILKVGDTIQVTGYRPGKYAPGVVDEMGTEALLKSMVGRRYTVKGFDAYGHVELEPKRLHTVWIERDLVEFVEDSNDSA